MEHNNYREADGVFQIFLDEIGPTSNPKTDKLTDPINRTVTTAIEDYSNLANKHPRDMTRDQLLTLVTILMDESHIGNTAELEETLGDRMDARKDKLEEYGEADY